MSPGLLVFQDTLYGKNRCNGSKCAGISIFPHLDFWEVVVSSCVIMTEVWFSAPESLLSLLPNYWPSLKTICQVFVEIWYFQFFVDFAPFLTPVQLHTTSTSEIVALELIAVGDFPYFPLVNKLTPKYEIALIFCSRYANKFIFGPNQDDKNHFRKFLSRIWSMTSCYGNMTDFAILWENGL